jgi:hypothetical protein
MQFFEGIEKMQEGFIKGIVRQDFLDHCLYEFYWRDWQDKPLADGLN